jgi:predicted dehydrogenase
MYLRELVKDGYVGQALSVNMHMMGSGVLTRTSDRTWQRDFSLGANTLTITFGHAIDALCMVVGEMTEVSAIVATQVPQWLETDTKKYVDVTAPDNIIIQGRLENGAVVNASVCVHPTRQRLPLRDLRQGGHADDAGRRGSRRGSEPQDRRRARKTTKRCRSCRCRTG